MTGRVYIPCWMFKKNSKKLKLKSRDRKNWIFWPLLKKYQEPEPFGKKIRSRSRSCLKKKSGAGAAKKFAGFPALEDGIHSVRIQIPDLFLKKDTSLYNTKWNCLNSFFFQDQTWRDKEIEKILPWSQFNTYQFYKRPINDFINLWYLCKLPKVIYLV